MEKSFMYSSTTYSICKNSLVLQLFKIVLLFVVVVVLPTHAFAKRTYVPDDNFEKFLVDAGYDDVMDDSIATLAAKSLKNMRLEGMQIADLTGIEDFTALVSLNCSFNQLST